MRTGRVVVFLAVTASVWIAADVAAAPGQEEDTAMTERHATDPHRTAYHFQPLTNWMNDPNGLIHWKGRYHLFYQYNPFGALWGNMHWGHAVSDDLVRWTHLPIALAPTPDGPDKDGVFSGCAVDKDGAPVLMYTGIAPEVQCIATGGDDMLTWTKHPANPVIGAPPDGLEVTGFRDPYVWREGDGWYAAVGSGIEGTGGAALLYRSQDLVSWEYLHPLLVGKKEETGTMWECPSFFPLGDKYVLLVSTLGTVLYFVGTYENHRFAPEYQGRMDHDYSFYAAQVFADAAGRRIAFGWLREQRNDEAQVEAGWSGAQSAPRVLALGPGGALRQSPAPELESARAGHARFENMRLGDGQSRPLEGARGDCLDIVAVIEPGNARSVGLHLRVSPDSREQTTVVYDVAAAAVRLDRRRSTLDERCERAMRGAPARLGPDGRLTLRILIDRSVIEVFAGEETCLTGRVYPTLAESVGIEVFARGGSATAHSIDVWEMAP